MVFAIIFNGITFNEQHEFSRWFLVPEEQSEDCSERIVVVYFYFTGGCLRTSERDLRLYFTKLRTPQGYKGNYPRDVCQKHLKRQIYQLWPPGTRDKNWRKQKTHRRAQEKKLGNDVLWNKLPQISRSLEGYIYA